LSGAASIRSVAAHEWRAYRDLRLRALADSPDAFTSTLAEQEGRPDDEWAARLASADGSSHHLPLVAELGGEPVGLVWGMIEPSEPDVAYLYQMWVAPSGRGVGIGRMLLDTVIAWAAAADARCLDLGVTFGDTPATRLYARAGFEPVEEPGPLRPGSSLLGQLMRLELRGRPVR
jgi:ribosomal protein S18 acetylase RimI-like enzyme